MEHREVSDHRVERVLGKRERLGACDAKVKPWIKLRGEPDHLLRYIHPDDRRPTLGGPSGGITRTCRDVEKPHTAASGYRIEQRLDNPPGDLPEEVVVPGRLRIPTRHLKRRERVQVDP